MSELSVRQYLHNDGSGLTLGYDKQEADKVIAYLENKLDLYKRGFKEDDRINAFLYTELRRHKYKRCLAMRNMCRYAQYSYSYLMENESCKILPNNIDFRRYNKKYHFYIRWRKRWLAIAEKFKTNSTAQ